MLVTAFFAFSVHCEIVTQRTSFSLLNPSRRLIAMIRIHDYITPSFVVHIAVPTVFPQSFTNLARTSVHPRFSAAASPNHRQLAESRRKVITAEAAHAKTNQDSLCLVAS